MVVDSAVATSVETKPENQETSNEELEAEYNLNIANGKKNLLCGDFPEAVACFQAACSLQSERFGETSHECAEVFYLYGRALLELARVENGVLGNALKGVPETEDSDSETEEAQFEKTKKLPANEREQLRQEVEAAMATETEEGDDTQDESGAEDVKNDAEKKPEEKNEKEEKMETEEKPLETVSEEKTESEKKEDDAGPSEPEKDQPSTKAEDEDPEDIPNMQLAWEMLELAKVLYQKKPKSKENSLHVAQCHLKLGELGLEIENYSQAIGDFLECLVLHKELLDKHDRRLAETHYSLGLAYSFHQRYDNALEHYNAALGVLETRIDFLNEQIDENDRKKEKSEETIQECAEVGEINQLIPDINSKIEDVMLMKKQEGRMAGSPFRQPSALGETSTGFGASPADKVCAVIPIRKASDSVATPPGGQAASDISHLVRRKRAAPENEPSSEGETTSPSKKIKRDTETNGTHTNGTNGADACNGDAPKVAKSAAELKEDLKKEANSNGIAMEN
uniref:Protein HGV2-like n=1 Tax=Phallusia mammillata TaxID=59560 RepID=A0A6F9DL79_9ASCI|nr:protein HGV2-like [Phallusia mammillata]